jgi:OFA family oxalate/formate antiporter-like MFS transporter
LKRVIAGAALTVIPIRYVIDTSGYQAAFLWFGLIQGGIIFVLAWMLRGPALQHHATQSHAVDAKLYAGRGVGNPGVLASVHHVRDGFGEPDRDGSDRAHRE